MMDKHRTESRTSGDCVDKISAARWQLGTASQLFVHDLEPISVQTLAAAAREILERECRSRDVRTIMDDLAGNAGRTTQDFRKLADQYGKVFRHSRPDDADADRHLMSSFTDQANDFVLFIAWHDYRRLTGKMPVEAQAIYSWVEAMYPDKMAIRREFSHIEFLADVHLSTRQVQKLQLRRLVDHCQQLEELLNHPETERKPLVRVTQY